MITFIIPNRGGEHIDFVISKISALYPDSKFIVITQEDNWLFRRGQLFNIAIKYVDTEYVCLHDNDIFFPEYIDFENMFKQNKRVIRPFTSITQVTLTADGYSKRSTSVAHGKGGTIFLSTDLFKEVNGFSNLYCGWGYEDNDFCSRCGDNFVTVPKTICHISHPHGYLYKLHVELNRIFREIRPVAADDGYMDTTCEIVYNNVVGNIRHIGVKNISVVEGYKYIDYLKMHGNINRAAKFICERSLKMTVNNDYVLIGLPKHMNFGDTLLWSAADQLLSSTGHKCIGYHFFGDENLKEVNSDTVIVFNGGGFLNDVWNSLPYVYNILNKYKNNRVVFLPNSIYFSSDTRKRDFKTAIDQHSGSVVIYVREQQSFDAVSKLFLRSSKLEFHMIPDIALAYDIDGFIKTHKDEISVANNKKSLYISRNDIEKKQHKNICADAVSDWPMLKSRPEYCNGSMSADWWIKNVKDRLTVEAINFILPYKEIYSDRMHGAILALLLKKKTHLLGNSYGKSKSLYETWLRNVRSIDFIE